MRKMKRILAGVLAAVTCFSAAALSACDDEPVTYTIQYVDDNGTHTLSVEAGALYTLEELPERFGYTFKGLYDARQDGTMYVDERGDCVSAFTNEQNIVLYPQFTPKSYTLVLDYQGAAVTAERSKTVEYNGSIGTLPTDVVSANKNFKGWYTQPNCQGTQVADEYGVLPMRGFVTENVYALETDTEYIHLYAGFEYSSYTVTFHYGNGTVETAQVQYGTNIRDVVTETRVNGNAVIAWSEKENDVDKQQLFTGTITGEKTLYAAEYAPVIEFNANGGADVPCIVARAGDAIVLPTATRENYRFMGWQEMGGNTYTGTAMPENSMTLTAVWQAMLVFDENGGTAVDDISMPMGEAVTLPTTSKADGMFAGWYTANGEKYESTSMPATSIVLKAGWYAVKTANVVVITADNKTTSENGPRDDWQRTVDLSNVIPSDVRQIGLTIHYKAAKHYGSSSGNSNTVTENMGMFIYDESVVSDSNLQARAVQLSEIVYGQYRSFSWSGTIRLKTSRFYICFYTDRSTVRFSDVWVEVSYPDMTDFSL